VEILKFYQGFEINDFTGEALTDNDMLSKHYKQLSSLQLLAWTGQLEKLKSLALNHIGGVDSRQALLQHLEPLSDSELHQFCERLGLIRADAKASRDFLLEVFVAAHERRASQLELINEMPLYPNEQLMWDESIIPASSYAGESNSSYLSHLLFIL
jgi:intron-binding protein aquarius